MRSSASANACAISIRTTCARLPPTRCASRKTPASFSAEAEAALGFPIEVIAGREEARLIYAGAAHSVPASAGKRLVVDIGGGSTEFIIGSHYTPIKMESLYIGCVSHSRQFFPAGNVDEYTMRQAELAAKREIQIISAEYKKTGWDQAIGSSGTARALAELVEANGFNDPGVTHGISRGGLERLKRALIKAENVNRLKLIALKPDRVPVLAGGLSIMLGGVRRTRRRLRRYDRRRAAARRAVRPARAVRSIRTCAR